MCIFGLLDTYSAVLGVRTSATYALLNVFIQDIVVIQDIPKAYSLDAMVRMHERS